MYLGSDCVIFKASSEVNIEKATHITSPFEKIIIKRIDANYILFTFSWLDPVRISKKLIETNQLSLTFLYYNESQTIVCFGNSESLINFAIKRIKDLLGIKLEKLELYDRYKKLINAELINVHLLNNSMNNENEVKAININNVPESILKSYFKENMVVSLTFKCYVGKNTKTYFYIDKGSVLSFPDLMEEEIIYALFDKAFNFL